MLKFSLMILISGFLAASVCRAETAWTQVDCGGINELLQVSRSFPANTKSLNYAQLLVLILGDKATYGWPERWPMPSNLYIGADVESVTPVTVPGATAADLVVIASKNHYPQTRVLCTFTDAHAD